MRREIAKSKHGNNGFGLTLGMAATSWPTPMAGTPAQNGNSAAGNNDFTRRAEELANLMWGTPRGSDGEKGGPNQSFGAGGTPLPAQAAQWFTPNVPNGGRTLQAGTSPTGIAPDGTKRQVGLENQARLWTTPQAHDVTARGSGQKPTSKAGNACLATDAANWPTPAGRDWKGENGADHLANGTGRLHLDQLPNFVAHCFTPPDPETLRHGPKLSRLRPIWRPLRASLIASHGRAAWRRLRRGARRLNPLFVEWLMGWPPGHALCACSATEYILWQQLMRGALSALPMDCGPWIWVEPKAAPVAVQMNLFGE